MRRIGIGVAAAMLVASVLGCCVLPQLPAIRVPEIELRVPSIQVGELQQKAETVPLGDEDSVEVDVRFGAGSLTISAGDGEALFDGQFAYNVRAWEPEVRYQDGELSIQQDRSESIPLTDRGIRNEWDLTFSPNVPLEINLRMAAGEGSLDLTGLQLEELDLDMGAGGLEVRFDDPNRHEMRRLTVDAGAGELHVSGIGHAGPERVRVQGGAGDVRLDFTGAWRDSSEVDVTAGVGQVTLLLPSDVGVRVERDGGLTVIEARDFQRLGDAFVNDAFGEAAIELRIRIVAGVGNIELIEVTAS